MPEAFVTELRRQRDRTAVQLRRAEAAGDDYLVAAMTSRLAELAHIAERNGIGL